MTSQKITRSTGLVILFFLSINLFAQNEESTGLLGDNFSLEAALEEFKKAKSLEAFEKAINKEDNHVHNLDLNEDGEIDYISVNDHAEKDVHAIVLSAQVAKNETQDVAVIEIEKDGKESAQLQIVGDVDLYGEDMIVEPYDIEGSSDGQGPDGEYEFDRVVFNVWLWPSVRFVYGPSYVVYRSPYYYSYYPGWWRPWRPLAWTVWRPFRVRYTPRYRVAPVRRVTHAHVVYRPHRSVSKTVTVKHKTSVTKARSHKVSRTNTKVAGVKTSNGKAVAAKKTTTTTRNANGVKKTTSTKVAGTNGQKSVKGSKQTKTKKVKGRNGKTVKAGKKTKTTKTKKGKKGVKKTKTVRKKKKG